MCVCICLCVIYLNALVCVHCTYARTYVHMSCCSCVHWYVCTYVRAYVHICTHVCMCTALLRHVFSLVHARSCLQVSQPMHNLRQSTSTSPTNGPHFNSGPGGSVTSISGASGISGYSTGGSDISPERSAQSK